MFLVQCNSCQKIGFTSDGRRLDAAVECDCCPEDHDHGKATEKRIRETPSVVDDGRGGHCRPVTITALPGTVPLVIEG